MKLILIEDVPEGFKYPDAALSMGDIVGKCAVGWYVILRIPLWFKRWQYLPWCDRDIYGRVQLFVGVVRDFVPGQMEYPRMRIKSFVHVPAENEEKCL